MKTEYRMTFPGSDRDPIRMKDGRDLWALRQLIEAGPRGITSYENAALRLDGNIFSLRQMGFQIDTEMEPDGGPYKGQHGRYLLRKNVRIEAV